MYIVVVHVISSIINKLKQLVQAVMDVCSMSTHVQTVSNITYPHRIVANKIPLANKGQSAPTYDTIPGIYEDISIKGDSQYSQNESYLELDSGCGQTETTGIYDN